MGRRTRNAKGTEIWKLVIKFRVIKEKNMNLLF